MIRLTRLNHQPIVVNAELIEYLETTPDTVISLVNGQKMAVLETLDQVMAEIINYQREIRQRPIVRAKEREQNREAESG
ncbi:MAG TPA: flagellar FlbD family protein [Bryobacterales bacterium]|jgi:flagellar protein FlbD|nr:flagellar FlbD family protein [Bryobacterales bacterium]